MTTKRNTQRGLQDREKLVNETISIWSKYDEHPAFIEFNEEGTVTYNFEEANTERQFMLEILIDELLEQPNLSKKNFAYNILVEACTRIYETEISEINEIVDGSTESNNKIAKLQILCDALLRLANEDRSYISLTKNEKP